MAGQAQVALLQEERETAVSWVNEILTYLEKEGTVGMREPFWVYLICYRVLWTTGDARAADVLVRANRLLQAQADRITDAARRQQFLTAVPAHQALQEAAQNQTQGR